MTRIPGRGLDQVAAVLEAAVALEVVVQVAALEVAVAREAVDQEVRQQGGRGSDLIYSRVIHSRKTKEGD